MQTPAALIIRVMTVAMPRQRPASLDVIMAIPACCFCLTPRVII